MTALEICQLLLQLLRWLLPQLFHKLLDGKQPHLFDTVDKLEVAEDTIVGLLFFLLRSLQKEFGHATIKHINP